MKERLPTQILLILLVLGCFLFAYWLLPNLALVSASAQKTEQATSQEATVLQEFNFANFNLLGLKEQTATLVQAGDTVAIVSRDSLLQQRERWAEGLSEESNDTTRQETVLDIIASLLHVLPEGQINEWIQLLESPEKETTVEFPQTRKLSQSEREFLQASIMGAEDASTAAMQELSALLLNPDSAQQPRVAELRALIEQKQTFIRKAKDQLAEKHASPKSKPAPAPKLSEEQRLRILGYAMNLGKDTLYLTAGYSGVWRWDSTTAIGSIVAVKEDATPEFSENYQLRSIGSPGLLAKAERIDSIGRYKSGLIWGVEVRE